MSDAIRIQGAWRDVASRYIRIGGVWRKVSSVAVRTGGAWKSTQGNAGPFTASAPNNVYGRQGGNRPVPVTSELAVISVKGGVPPYSYTWTFAYGDNRITATDPTQATTYFRATLLNTVTNAGFNWTARDAQGTLQSGTTNVQLEAGVNN